MSGDKYIINDQAGCYFVTFTVIHWIDIFTRKEYRDLIVESLNYCIANKGLQVYAWVIMSNHIHLIASVKDKSGILSSVIRDFKKYTSRKISLAIQTIGESRREWILKAINKKCMGVYL